MLSRGILIKNQCTYVRTVVLNFVQTYVVRTFELEVYVQHTYYLFFCTYTSNTYYVHMYNCTYSTDIFVTLRAKLKMVDFFEPLSFIKQVNSCGLKEAGRWQIAGDSIGTYQSYLHTYSLHIWWLFTVVTPSACFIYLVGGVGKQARRSGGSSRIP